MDDAPIIEYEFDLGNKSISTVGLKISDDLVTELQDHQKQGVAWMLKQESSSTRGGILADACGLGKTIQTIALLLSGDIRTLIVCDFQLITEWLSQFKRHTKMKTSNNVVMLYHGQRRHTYDYTKARIVFTTYGVISREWNSDSRFTNGSLFNETFGRVVLDEAHAIKNRRSMRFEGVVHIKSKYKWALTATPISNRMSEMYTYLKFLGKFDNYPDFKEIIKKDRQGVKTLHEYMNQVCLRRNSSILNLPEKIESITEIEWTEIDREFYGALRSYSYSRIVKLMKRMKEIKRLKKLGLLEKGRGRLAYQSFLTYILRLRQACCSAELVIRSMARTINSDSIKDATDVLKYYTENPNEIEECCVCMDQEAEYVSSPCGHKCCKQCWIQIQKKWKQCPQCWARIDRFDLIQNETENAVKSLKDIVVRSLVMGRVDPSKLISQVPQDCIDVIEAAIQKRKVMYSTKTLMLLDLISKWVGQGHKVIVGCQWVKMIGFLQNAVDIDLGIKHVTIMGKMNQTVRQSNLEEFKTSSETNLCFVSLMCMSEGLTITEATKMVLFEPFWNETKPYQLSQRIYRIGQTQKVEIIHLRIENSIETKIQKMVEKKAKITQMVMTGKYRYDSFDWMKELIKLVEN